MKHTPRLRPAAVLGLLAAIGLTFVLAGGLTQAAPDLRAAALPDDPALPTAWGSPVHVPKAGPKAAVKSPASRQLLPLPAPDRFARMPAARVTVGQGRVDPVYAFTASGGAFLYVVKAPTPGVVEYVYPQRGTFQAGEALVRLYDLAILSDLRIGESAMARFASSPFVIAAPNSSLPPLPPGTDFPQPTAAARSLGITLLGPMPTTMPEMPLPRHNSGLEPANPSGRPSLARSSGLAPQRATVSRAETRRATDNNLPEMSQLSEQLADTHRSLEQYSSALGRLESQMAAARSRVEQAKVDESSSRRLYEQGVLARNVYESTQAKVKAAEQDLAELQQQRSEIAAAREQLSQRSGKLQGQIDDTVARQGREAARANAAEETLPDDLPTIDSGSRNVAPKARARAASRRSALRAPQGGFPSPTTRQRPDLAALPRVPATSRLRPTVELPALPESTKRLATPRWKDQMAPSDGVVVKQLVPEGVPVKAGTPLLQVANREWARIYADIRRQNVENFPIGAPITATFDEYPGVKVEGWINAVNPVKGTDLARVEMVVLCRDGYYPDDTYASLQWLTLAAPLVEKDRREPLEPGLEVKTAAASGKAKVYELLPLVPPQVGPGQEIVATPRRNEFVGVVRLGEMDLQSATPQTKQRPEHAKRLATLRQWRESFIEGMTTTLFGDLSLTYPRQGEVARAVERMATAQVSHDNNRCARTMREALGWGLGDAAMWMKRLPEKGYVPRADGLARPGDILVWPFTYGPRRNQHIGIAVNQGGRLMLLSNLSGTLGTVELQPGYLAFYQPGAAKPAAKTKPTSPTVKKTQRQ